MGINLSDAELPEDIIIWKNAWVEGMKRRGWLNASISIDDARDYSTWAENNRPPYWREDQAAYEQGQIYTFCWSAGLDAANEDEYEELGDKAWYDYQSVFLYHIDLLPSTIQLPPVLQFARDNKAWDKEAYKAEIRAKYGE